jgi:hypothetical protein
VNSKTLGLSRRELLCAAGSLLAVRSALSAPVLSNSAFTVNAEDAKFLEDCAHRSFGYFLDHWNARTGLVKDRAGVDGSPSALNVASTAATGFGLSAMCIAAIRGWLPKEQARQHVLTTLRFLWDHAFHDHGWYLHFMDADTGERRLNSEISSIDTALLLAGVLSAQGYFANDKEIKLLARQIYERVDFAWMLNGDAKLLCHGVMPGSGFLKSRWEIYSEASILYLLAIGSPRHSIPVDSWYAWLRPEVRFDSWKFISGGALFTHQYSHAWIDFRHLRDGDPSLIDYFQNSQIATYAHRDFCISLRGKYADYGPNMWGVTVSDSPLGYVDWGGNTMPGSVNGTLVPCAAAGSLMFAPEICLPVLREMFSQYGDKIYRRYGFADAFNPNWKDKKFWVDHDVVGIDVGITLLSIENLLTGNMWRYFMRNAYIQNAMEKVGFRISTPGTGIREVRTGASRG